MTPLRSLIIAVEEEIRLTMWNDQRAHLYRVLEHLRIVEGELLAREANQRKAKPRQAAKR